MGRLRHSATGLACVAGLLAAAGCQRDEQQHTQTQPAPPAKAVQPKLTVIAPESAEWSREEAVLLLPDEALGVSAAVRLVRLAEASPLCVPADLTDATARRLRLVPLADDLWALGLRARRNERVLHTPLLIGQGGAVYVVADGTEEEALLLHISANAEIFPHLLTSPERILLAADPPDWR